MMLQRNFKRMLINVNDGVHLLHIGTMEIWDGADLALIRETLTSLIEQDGYRAIGINLSAVKYIPSGFFGMLFEWYEQGLKVCLYDPQVNVAQMLWFRMFFISEDHGSYILNDHEMRGNSPSEQVAYRRREFMSQDESDDDDDVEVEVEVEVHRKSAHYAVRGQV